MIMQQMEQKAATLGPDLYSAKYSIHITPARLFRHGRSGAILPSGYSFLEANSLHDAPLMIDGKTFFVSPHNPGEEMHTWAMPFEYLEILKIRQEPVVYIQKVRELLKKELRFKERDFEWHQQNLEDPLAGQNIRRTISYLKTNISALRNMISRCSTVQAADRAMTFLIKLKSLSYSFPECPQEVVGIIFAINQRIRDECDIHEDTEGGFTVHASNSELLLKASRTWNDQPSNVPARILSVEDRGEISAVSRLFYSQFLHAIWAVYPGKEAANRVVRNMLRATENKPQHTVPVYDYTGRLHWPSMS